MENDLKINDLVKLDTLEKRCEILLNCRIDDRFYDYYMFNKINWLLENEDKINNDYFNNLNLASVKFHVILNSHLNERFNLILKINSLEEFAKYVNFIPFKLLNKRAKNKIEKMFNNFINIDDDYLKVSYFDRISR